MPEWEQQGWHPWYNYHNYLKLIISTVKSTSPTLSVFVPGHLAAHLRAQTLLSALGEFVPGNFFRIISFGPLVLLRYYLRLVRYQSDISNPGSELQRAPSRSNFSCRTFTICFRTNFRNSWYCLVLKEIFSDTLILTTLRLARLSQGLSSYSKLR